MFFPPIYLVAMTLPALYSIFTHGMSVKFFYYNEIGFVDSSVLSFVYRFHMVLVLFLAFALPIPFIFNQGVDGILIYIVWWFASNTFRSIVTIHSYLRLSTSRYLLDRFGHVAFETERQFEKRMFESDAFRREITYSDFEKYRQDLESYNINEAISSALDKIFKRN